MKWRSSLIYCWCVEGLSYVLLKKRGRKKRELASFPASNRGAVSVFEFEFGEVYCFNSG